MKSAFIYALKELAPGEFFSTKIRYIGKSNDPYRRFEEHCKTKEKTHLGCWVRSLPARGLSLQLEVLDEVPDVESIWGFWEREYIRVFRAIGFNLVNEAAGGEGGTPSEETRAKMSASKLGNLNSLGRKHSEETKRKMGLGHRGKKYKKHSEEACAKKSARLLNQKPQSNCSGFVGVCWHSSEDKWIANFRIEDKKKKHVGYFSKIEDAVLARALAMDKHFSKE